MKKSIAIIALAAAVGTAQADQKFVADSAPGKYVLVHDSTIASATKNPKGHIQVSFSATYDLGGGKRRVSQSVTCGKTGGFLTTYEDGEIATRYAWRFGGNTINDLMANYVCKKGVVNAIAIGGSKALEEIKDAL